MNSITRNVRDIDGRERQALEYVLGQPLKEDQQIIIQVVTAPKQPTADQVSADKTAPTLPEWCDVYDGLTDDEIAEIEKIALSRADMTRPSE